MGPEPFLQTMAAHPDFDIIIGGRAYDPAPYVAFCAYHALNKVYQPIVTLDKGILGGFTHMGKLMECGGACSTPKSSSSMAVIYRDGMFDVRPLKAGSRCTTVSVAAHTMYEKTRPDILHGPGGHMDLTESTYVPLIDNLSVRVHGATFTPSKNNGGNYTIKLEGAKVTGFRTVFMGSFADPILISNLPTLLEIVKDYVAKQNLHVKGKWDLDFHVYGRNQIIQNTKVLSTETPFVGEVFLVGEAIAESQAEANGIAATARIACVHGPYSGQKATSGNFGFGLGGKMEIEMGLCAEFSVYHLIDLDDGEEEANLITETTQKTLEGAEKALGLFSWEMKMLGVGDRIQPFPITEVNSDLNGGNEISSQTIPALLPPKNSLPSPPPESASFPLTLGDAAKVIRSKNAGPYELTFDVLFDDKNLYNRIKSSGTLKSELIAQIYNIEEKDVIYCGFFDQAMAFKVTIPRLRHCKARASGGFMENDVHGSQQYIPLLNLRLNLPLCE
jgi:hypothetical protein